MIHGIRSMGWTSLLCAAGALAAASLAQEGAPKGEGGAPHRAEEKEQGLRDSNWPVRWRDGIYFGDDGDEPAASNDAQTEQRQAEMRRQLSDLFDAEMRARKEKMEEIASRLKKLQEQYEARQAAKEAIIEMQMELLEREKKTPLDGSPRETSSPSGAEVREAGRLSDQARDGLSSKGATTYFDLERVNRTTSLDGRLMMNRQWIDERLRQKRIALSADREYFATITSPISDGVYTVTLMHQSGWPLAKYESPTVIEEIRFEESGLAIRMQERDFEVKIARPYVDVSYFYKKKWPLGKLRFDFPFVIEELKRLGRFAESEGGEFYALADCNREGEVADIYILNSATGAPLHQSLTKGPIGPLHFMPSGLVTKQPDGRTSLLAPSNLFSENSQERSRAMEKDDQVLAEGAALPPDRSTGGGVDAYGELRMRYLSAKAELERLSMRWEDLVRKAKEREPDLTKEQLEARLSAPYKDLQDARRELQNVTKVIEAGIALLSIDEEVAQKSAAVADAEWRTVIEVNRARPNTVNPVEMQKFQLKTDKSRAEHRRAKMLLDLFKSILEDKSVAATPEGEKAQVEAPETDDDAAPAGR